MGFLKGVMPKPSSQDSQKYFKQPRTKAKIFLNIEELGKLIKPEYLEEIKPHMNTFDKNLLTYYLIINLKEITDDNVKEIKRLMSYDPVLKFKLVGYEVNSDILLLTFETVTGLKYIILNKSDKDFDIKLSSYVNNEDMLSIKREMGIDISNANVASAKYGQYCYGS